jgi:hypothetical protein
MATLSASLHNGHTPPVQRTYRTCGHCAPALRAGALLACPDAQGALRKPFLTSPPHHGTGEVRSGTAAKRVRSGQQGKTKVKVKVKVKPRGIIGLRPPSATLRAAHDSTGEDCAREESRNRTLELYRRPAASICHAPRGTRQHRRRPRPGGKQPAGRQGCVAGLRPPSSALRAAHDGTGNAGILPGHDECRL